MFIFIQVPGSFARLVNVVRNIRMPWRSNRGNTVCMYVFIAVVA
jgi:hypothetical protein